MARPRGVRSASYEEKRSELLRKVTARLMQRQVVRPSMRDLAAAAEISVPTLRHYFGSRHEIVDAVLAECLRQGRAGLARQEQSERPFDESMRDYAQALVRALTQPRDVQLGDIFAVSLAEGLLDKDVSPSTLRHILHPTIEALERRLHLHIGRGEMREAETHAAALMLIAPILLACLHQNQLGGAFLKPIALEALADTISAAFVRAFAKSEAASP